MYSRREKKQTDINGTENNTVKIDAEGTNTNFSCPKTNLNDNDYDSFLDSQATSLSTSNTNEFDHVDSDSQLFQSNSPRLEIFDTTIGPITITPNKSNLNHNAICFTPKLTEVVSGSFISMPKRNTLNNANNSYNLKEMQNSPLHKLRLKNSRRIFIGHLNVNSIRNKFDMVFDLIKGQIDIFLISETKIDSTFPSSQFKMPGYTTPYRLDRSECAGGLLLYVREDIPSKLLKPNFHSDIECIVIEFSIYKRKWLLLGL